MSLANGTESNFLKLLFTAVAWAAIADNTATTPATQLFISLHNADPGEAGTQSTNETAYTNYARVAVNRTTGGFTVSGTDPTQVVNAATITFPQCGVTGDTITHWGIGLLSTGTGTLLACGPVGSGPALNFTCTSASPGVLTIPGSSYSVNDRVSLYHNPAGTLPTGTTEGTVYFVGTVTGIAVTLSTTAANGAPVNTSSVGAGVSIKQTPLVVANLITPSFAAGQLVLQMD